MGREQATRIIEILEKAGFPAYFVGGCVRDMLLGREPEDWDIASAARPEQVMALFGADALPTGCKHGSVTVKCGGEAFEVTTFGRTWPAGTSPSTPWPWRKAGAFLTSTAESAT